MANYEGRNALRMRCFAHDCNKISDHHVIKTFDGQYHWDKSHISLFQRIAGQDISYRRRSRECGECGAIYETAELHHYFLAKLVEEVDRLAAALASTEQQLAAEQARVIELQEAVDRSHRILDTCRTASFDASTSGPATAGKVDLVDAASARVGVSASSSEHQVGASANDGTKQETTLQSIVDLLASLDQ